MGARMGQYEALGIILHIIDIDDVDVDGAVAVSSVGISVRDTFSNRNFHPLDDVEHRYGVDLRCGDIKDSAIEEHIF